MHENTLYQFFMKHHKHIYWIGLVISILTCLCFDMALTNDVWFMISHAHHMIDSGFYPGTDVLSMHTDFVFVYQKWAMCFLSYGVYQLFGRAGLYAGCYVLYAMFNASVYWLLNKLNPKALFCNIPVVIGISFACMTYMNFRPHVVAGILIIYEIYVLETYAAGKMSNIRLNISMFVISLLFMWFHSTMWYVCLIPIVSYLFDGILNNKFIQSNKYDKLPIFGSIVLACIAACAQPNGLYQFKYMLICISATGDKYSHIDELMPFYEVPLHVMIFAVIIVISSIVLYHNKRLSLRSFYWFIGSVILCFISDRLMFYAMIFFAVALVSDIHAYWTRSSYKNCTNRLLYEAACVAGISIMALMISFNTVCDYFKPTHIALYEGYYDGLYIIDEMDDAIDIRDLKLFTTSEVGSYCTIYGAKPYYDCRAEVYDIALNQSSDVLSEFPVVCTAMSRDEFTVQDVLDFQEKYDFDYWILHKELRPSEHVFLEAGAVCSHSAGEDGYAVYSFKHDTIF